MLALVKPRATSSRTSLARGSFLRRCGGAPGAQDHKRPLRQAGRRDAVTSQASLGAVGAWWRGRRPADHLAVPPMSARASRVRADDPPRRSTIERRHPQRIERHVSTARTAAAIRSGRRPSVSPAETSGSSQKAAEIRLDSAPLAHRRHPRHLPLHSLRSPCLHGQARGQIVPLPSVQRCEPRSFPLIPPVPSRGNHFKCSVRSSSKGLASDVSIPSTSRYPPYITRSVISPNPTVRVRSGDRSWTLRAIAS